MRAWDLIISILAGFSGPAIVLFLTAAQETKTPTPPSSATTPTVDRLAAPPTAEHPTQADNGAQLFWLHCQPCHGDQGQGLTDEWRAQYPPEDQNCWESGCHGRQPYENGFILPESVPAVIGEDSLARFETMGQMHSYIRAAMPFQEPGNLSDEEYLAIVAYLAREHGVWDGRSLDSSNVYEMRLRPPPVVAETTPAAASSDEHLTVEPGPEQRVSRQSEFPIDIAILVAGIFSSILLLAGGIWLWKRREQ
jgi:mono/diheme cytochrome c family protein